MSTVPLDALRDGKFETAQVVDIRLLWEPRAGRTLVSRDATNLVIRHVILVDGEVGIYGGGGFGWPSGTPGETGFGLEITGSSVSLVDSTEGFIDLMSPATLLGSIAGPLDAATTVEFRTRSRRSSPIASVGPAGFIFHQANRRPRAEPRPRHRLRSRPPGPLVRGARARHRSPDREASPSPPATRRAPSRAGDPPGPRGA